MRDHVHGARQLLDRVADELARAVPGDLAAPVHVHDGSTVQRTLLGRGTAARGVDRRVFEEQAGVGDLVRETGGVHTALLVPGLLVVDRVRSETQADEPQLIHGQCLPRTFSVHISRPQPLYGPPLLVSSPGNRHTIG